MAPEQFDAIVVGGSIAGLMHAVSLRSLGRKVAVLESRESSELHAEAAGLSLGPSAQKLVNKYLEIDDSFAIASPSSQILSPSGAVVAEIPAAFPVTTSTWSLVYERLKQKFLSTEGPGNGSTYRTGLKVIRLDYDDQDGPVRVICADKAIGIETIFEAPLVIGADGARSAIRHQVQPGIESKYAGYVAWRGYIPEAQTPETLKGALEGKLVFTMLQGHYIIAYLTPGPNGSIKQGDRLLDWCWYCPVEAESLEFADIMTDNSGHRHNRTVPRGSLREEVWTKQLANYPLTAGWEELIHQSQETFVTAVTSHEGSSTAYYDGKVLLAGEAFTQFRPHLGLSCDLAALQALTLSEVLTAEKTMSEYEKIVGDYADEFSMRSSAMGQFGLTGKWPEGYVPLYAKKAE